MTDNLNPWGTPPTFFFKLFADLHKFAASDPVRRIPPAIGRGITNVVLAGGIIIGPILVNNSSFDRDASELPSYF